ncbi:MAG: HAMP domain-containing sensor histidine kinase [Ruminococcus sp.]|nr:HAMP domain-containing sensor histidine kinase [Ruminococcus sp.]
MKKLRRKIILGVFFSVLVVFALTVVVIGTALNMHLSDRSDSITKLINNSDGEFPSKHEYDKMSKEEQIHLYDFDDESRFRMRYFVVYFDSKYNVKSVKTDHIAAVDKTTAGEMASDVLYESNTTGYYGDYRYRYSEDTNSVIFLNISGDAEGIRIIMIFISIVALIFVLLITVIFYFLSKRIVKPFEENSRMQKQFITDASHELKTPLAIISANAEVLAYKDGENEWINNITAQVERIGGLINELLTLNRLEEIDTVVDIEPVNLSELIYTVSADFEQVFKGEEVSVKYDVQPDVVINGNRNQLERLISVLVENASKYISAGGEFRITLKKEMRYTTLSVFNTCEIDPNVDYKYLFDRFYRPDSSRTSGTGGHGIGLSIAKRIATLHNGSIAAVPQVDGLSFNVKLSNRMRLQKKNKG